MAPAAPAGEGLFLFADPPQAGPGQEILLYLVFPGSAAEPWEGKLLFDVPRHKTQLHLPLDYPRINQFPEWFTVEAGRKHTVRNLAAGSETACTGKQMSEGIPVKLEAGKEARLLVKAEDAR